MAYLTSSLFVRDKQPSSQLTRATSTRSVITPASSTTTMDSPSGDVPRQSILGFLNRGGRARGGAANTTNASSPINDLPSILAGPILSPITSNANAASNGNNPNVQPASSNANGANTHSAISNPRRRTVQPGMGSAQNASNPLGYMLRRRRSANNVSERERDRREISSNPRDGSTTSRQRDRERERDTQTLSQPPQVSTAANGPTHRIRLVPHLDSLRSLNFEAVCRDVRQGDPPLRIGRFTEQPGTNSNKLAFKSKVVSRGHAEVWFDSGTFYIKDTKSSSGTFLNHIRLSSPNTESRPFPIKDGDVLQLGVDYQGGTEEIYRCVKMRVELGREWQSGINAFNSNALAQLKSLTLPATQPGTRHRRSKSKKKAKAASAAGDGTSQSQSPSVPDCCICLSTVTVCQALFIAPCSHVYHYKCIRPLLLMHHPGFSCPICRTFANLEADVEEVGGPFGDDDDDDDVNESDEDSVAEDSGPGGTTNPPGPIRLPTREEVDAEMREAHDMDVEADPGAGIATGESGDRAGDDDELEYVSVEEGVLVNPRTNSGTRANNASTDSGNNATSTSVSRRSGGTSGVNAQVPTPSNNNAPRAPNVMNANNPLPAIPSNTSFPFPPMPPPPSSSYSNQAHVMARSRSLSELHASPTDDQTEFERDPSSPRSGPQVHTRTTSSNPAVFAGFPMDSSLVAEAEEEVGGEGEGATFLGGVPARVRAGERELVDVRMEDGADEEVDGVEGPGLGLRGKRKRRDVFL